MDASKPTFATIDDYIATFPPEDQALLRALRQTIREAAPDAQETISYQMPTFKQHGNLVHFAAFPHHIGFYPTPSGVAAFQQELAPYVTSKGTVQFPKDQPLPLDLVRQIVEHRVAENLEKQNNKKSKKG